MSIAFIRQRYPLARVNGTVTRLSDGKRGVIVGTAGEYLRVRFGGDVSSQTVKPNEVAYQGRSK